MRERDFRLTVDRASGLLLDCTCAARAALAAGQLPPPHRRWIQRAISNLERAQDDLFKARNDPWSWPERPKHPQLELL